jgi:hypothetical protein
VVICIEVHVHSRLWVSRHSFERIVITKRHIPLFHNLFLLTAHPRLTVACEGTPQKFALRKGGTKQHVATMKCGWVM